MSNLKVEGKVADFCPKCKNCKAVTHNYDGITAKITEVECEDPYDGMVKTLLADNNICCSMFEPKPPCETCDKISLLQHELEMDKLRRVIIQLGREKADHLKGIERLKKSQEKLQNQVKNLQTTNEESYKREEKLEDKCRKLERRLLEENKRFRRLDSEFLMPLARVLYPGEKVNKPYSDILKDIKDIKDFRLEKMMKMIQYEDELISLNTINKDLAEDRKKLINYIRSLKIASENYLKEFTYEED